MHAFEKFSDIEIWLKEQWAGLFRELIRRMSEQEKFTELSHQVDDLKEINTTLKTYLESVMKVVSPDESEQLIESESLRLKEKEQIESLRNIPLIGYLSTQGDATIEDVASIIANSKNFKDFIKKIRGHGNYNENVIMVLDAYAYDNNEIGLLQTNEAREVLGLKKLK